MPEEQSTSATNENLRLALPLMASYQIPVTPANYSVWYEYVSGANGPLTQAIDKLIEDDHTITEDDVHELYERHVVEPMHKKLTRTRAALRSLLDDLGADVSRADGDVTRYQESLAGYSTRLSGSVDTAELRDVILGLTKETRSVRETGAQLQTRLEESRREAEALRKELEQARKEATTDTLTGLANRKAFLRALEEATRDLDDDEPGHPCLLLLDIDHFKKVNDDYGHLLGDKVIRFIGSIMRDGVKGQDLVARYGGEEFAILLPDTPYGGALTVAENIRTAIEGGRLVRSDTRQPIGAVTVSVGVAVYRAGEPLEAFIARADEALYHSKKNGRNRVSGEADPMAKAG